nr:DNA modification methylase [Candidatus Sigynarchaeota archaeon]
MVESEKETQDKDCCNVCGKPLGVAIVYNGPPGGIQDALKAGIKGMHAHPECINDKSSRAEPEGKNDRILGTGLENFVKPGDGNQEPKADPDPEGLSIDPEFSKLIQPLTREEYGGLEKSIVEHGFDPALGKIITWKDHGKIIVDGHTRYRICRVHEKPYEFEEKEFASRDEVKIWIINNQLNRRNLTPEQRAYLIGKRYESEKKDVGAPGGSENAASHGSQRVMSRLENNGVTFTPLVPGANPVPKPGEKRSKTSQKLADKAKVSEKTIHNAAAFAKAIDAIAANTGIQPQAILSRDMAATQQIVKDVAKMPKESQQKVMEKIKGSKGMKASRDVVKQEKQEIKRAEMVERLENLPKTKASTQLVMQGDFLDVAIEPASVDLAITSPNYNLDKKYGEATDDFAAYNLYLDFTRKYLEKIFALLKDGGRLCLNVPLDTNKGGHHAVCAAVTTIAQEVGFQYHSTIIWNESNISSGTAWGTFASAKAPCIISPVEVIIILYKKDWTRAEGTSSISADEFKQWAKGMWTFKGESATKVGHPAPFPVELPDRCVKLFSYVGDTVLDSFLGSGTTLVACVQNNRKGIGVEINAEFCSLARARVREAEASMAKEKDSK